MTMGPLTPWPACPSCASPTGGSWTAQRSSACRWWWRSRDQGRRGSTQGLWEFANAGEFLWATDTHSCGRPVRPHSSSAGLRRAPNPAARVPGFGRCRMLTARQKGSLAKKCQLRTRDEDCFREPVVPLAMTAIDCNERKCRSEVISAKLNRYHAGHPAHPKVPLWQAEILTSTFFSRISLSTRNKRVPATTVARPAPLALRLPFARPPPATADVQAPGAPPGHRSPASQARKCRS